MEYFFFGYLTGLSVGFYCLSLCLPIFIPLVLAQKRSLKTSLWLFVQFTCGRLFGYLAFAMLFGWLGQFIKNEIVHYLVSIINIWAGIMMILYALINIDKKFCPAKLFTKFKWSFVLGFLTGVNVCPPFLASLTFVFNLRSMLRSLIYFLFFFLGTTTYLAPMVLAGFFTKYNLVPKISRLAGVIVGIYFILSNLFKIV